MGHHAQVAVHEITQVGAARRQAVRLAETAAMGASSIGNVAIIVTELATNLQRYARDGKILLRCTSSDGFEVISMDRGPGMDVHRCLQDGYSTGGSSGTGLGAVRRLADDFDIYTSAEQGTVVWAKILPAGADQTASKRLQYAGISLPAPGEEVCGDAWATHVDQDCFRVVVADGVGHGSEAAHAGDQVIQQFRGAHASWEPRTFLERTHKVLAGTRGAAVATGHISHNSNQFIFAGVGNVSATILSHQSSKGLMSYNGTLGAHMRSVQSLNYDWPRDGFLVLHTDGLKTRWSESSYPGILTHHPALLAAVLIRDHIRGRDDVTAVIIRRR